MSELATIYQNMVLHTFAPLTVMIFLCVCHMYVPRKFIACLHEHLLCIKEDLNYTRALMAFDISFLN